MADDALTRKEAEMTREQVCSAEFRARIIGYGAHGAAPRLTVSEAEQLCDLALRALSLESVREEALEELQRLVKLLADLAITESEIEQEFMHGPRVIFEKGGQIAVRDVLMARKALQHAPARVAEGDSMPADETFAEKVQRLQDARDQIDAELSELL